MALFHTCKDGKGNQSVQRVPEIANGASNCGQWRLAAESCQKATYQLSFNRRGQSSTHDEEHVQCQRAQVDWVPAHGLGQRPGNQSTNTEATQEL